MNEAQVQIANKMYEARRTLRGLMRDTYAMKIHDWMLGVKAVADGTGQDYLHACMSMLQSDEASGMAMLLVLAATVELIEPDEHSPRLEAA